MGGDTLGGAPSFPLPVLVAVSALLAIPLYLAARRLHGDAARFLIGALWLRYVMSVFHVVTYQQVAGGLSINAIGSILVTGLGLMLIDKRFLLHKALLPVYALILLSMLSALANEGLFSAADTVVKYVYFCTILIATYQALQDNPAGTLFRRLLFAFAPLLVFQLLSVATGVVKASELDGSRSFIGGYNHEAAFSVALATFFLVAAFAEGLRKPLKAALLVAIMGGIALANYRTTILALLPFLLYLIVSRTAGLFKPRQRPFLVVFALVLVAGGLAVAADAAGSRFADLVEFLSRPADFIKPPETFSVEERRLLSGRVYIWSGYIHAWIEATPIQHLIGFGPDSWSSYFRVYPHNTLVAFLFELGLLGLAVLTWWWVAMLRLAAGALPGRRGDLLFAQMSFILLNLATMALWQIEGLILFAIVCGCSMIRTPAARIAGSQSRGLREAPDLLGGTRLAPTPTGTT